jgi:hypothetical protein
MPRKTQASLGAWGTKKMRLEPTRSSLKIKRAKTHEKLKRQRKKKARSLT